MVRGPGRGAVVGTAVGADWESYSLGREQQEMEVRRRGEGREKYLWGGWGGVAAT